MNLLFCIALALAPKYEVICDTTSIVLQAELLDMQEYVPLRPLAALLGLNYVADNTIQRVILSDATRRLGLTPDIPVIALDTLDQNLPFGPRYYLNQLYYPVHQIVPTIGGHFNRLVFLKRIEENPIIDKVSLAARGDSTVVSFTWTKPLTFDVQFTPQSAVIEIDGQLKDKRTLKPAGTATAVKLLPFTTYTRIELELKDVNAFLEREAEIVFYKKIARTIKVIVLDPGHGGIDAGAVGKNGLYEKDVNLDLCKLLKDLIDDSLGLKTLTTRETDVHVSLKKRTDFANSNAADMFISIHCNAAPRNRQARGFETYFLSEARTNEARAVAALENASLQFDDVPEPTGEVNYIFYDLAQSAFLEESNRLAEQIQASAERRLDIPARGVNQAGFYVLRGAFMPAILVECAFISNAEEEKLLRQKDFKKKLAYAIFCGLREYLQDYERRLNN